MSNQVYPNQIAKPYIPIGLTDRYTLQSNFPIGATSGPTWAGLPMGVNICNGVNGTLISGEMRFVNGQLLSTQGRYYAKNKLVVEGGGTVFYILKDGVYQFSGTIAWNTPGLNNWRGIGIRVTEPDGTVRPLVDANSHYANGTPTEGFATSATAVLHLAAGSQVRVIALSNDGPTESLPADRGASTQILVTVLA